MNRVTNRAARDRFQDTLSNVLWSEPGVGSERVTGFDGGAPLSLWRFDWNGEAKRGGVTKTNQTGVATAAASDTKVGRFVMRCPSRGCVLRNTVISREGS